MNDKVFEYWLRESLTRSAEIINKINIKFCHVDHEDRQQIKDALLDKGIRHIHWTRQEVSEEEAQSKMADSDFETLTNNNPPKDSHQITPAQIKYIETGLIKTAEDIEAFEDWCRGEDIEVRGTAKGTIEALSKSEASRAIEHLKED